MKYYVFYNPTDGKPYLIRANTAEQARTQVVTKFRNMGVGETDLAQIMGGDATQNEISDEVAANYKRDFPGSYSDVSGDVGGQPVTQPPASTPPTSTPPAGTPPVDPETNFLGGAPGVYDDETNQTGAFTRALKNRGVSGAGSLGDYYRGRQGAYQSAYGAGQAQGQFTDAEGQPSRSFENFATTNNDPYANLSQAFGKFSQLNTSQAGRDPSAYFQYQYADPRDEEGGGYTAANNLASGAFQGRLGGLTGNRYSRALPRLQEEYDSMDVNARQGTNYLDFLRKRLGLSGVQF